MPFAMQTQSWDALCCQNLQNSPLTIWQLQLAPTFKGPLDDSHSRQQSKTFEQRILRLDSQEFIISKRSKQQKCMMQIWHPDYKWKHEEQESFWCGDRCQCEIYKLEDRSVNEPTVICPIDSQFCKQNTFARYELGVWKLNDSTKLPIRMQR